MRICKKVMKGNKKVAKNKGVPNERRRLSLRPRTTPIAKTPMSPKGRGLKVRGVRRVRQRENRVTNRAQSQMNPKTSCMYFHCRRKCNHRNPLSYTSKAVSSRRFARYKPSAM
ncbi:unnamed protein product [Brassica oleracea]